ARTKIISWKRASAWIRNPIDRRCAHSTVRQLIQIDRAAPLPTSEKILRQFEGVRRGVVEVVRTTEAFQWRRHFLITDGKCHRLARGELFCVACCEKRSTL